MVREQAWEHKLGPGAGDRAGVGMGLNSDSGMDRNSDLEHETDFVHVEQGQDWFLAWALA